MIDRETLKLFYLGWPAYYEQDAGSSSRQLDTTGKKIYPYIEMLMNALILQRYHRSSIIKSLLKYSGIRACPAISYALDTASAIPR